MNTLLGILRQATATDANAIAALVNSAYRPAEGREGWTHERGIVSGSRITPAQVVQALQSGVIFVALDRSDVTACVHVEIKREDAHIGMLAVDPARQNSGLGQWLLTHAEHYARGMGALNYVLTVVGGRPELVAFYERRGYRITRETKPFPIEANVGVPGNPDLKLAVLRKQA